MKKLKEIKISGISLPLYAFFMIVLAVTIGLGKLPLNMVGITLLLVLLGHLLYFIGEKLPIMNSYLGGGSVFTLLGATLLSFFHIIPANVISAVGKFMGGQFGFLDFYIAALICGSILGMNRSLLVKASAKFIPVALVTMVVGFFAVGGMGVLLGNGFADSVMYVSMPMMSGGMGAGITPLSQIYADGLANGNQTAIFSQLAPAVTFGNIIAIIGALSISKIFAKSKYNGHGTLVSATKEELAKPKIEFDATKIGVGMLYAFTLLMVGVILNKFFPNIHEYAFMIIIVFVLKAFDAVPKELEESVVMFNQIIMTNLTHAVLAGIGLALIDLTTLGSALTWQFIVLCLTSVIVMGLTSWFLGLALGMYPVETAIGAGMINNSMGGTGNIAVLSASDRMEMIAFAQMANRLCGAIVLIMGGILIRFFY
ncbi:2-hydroxycarboxylate transporter family protein [Lactococcus formosensis]|uniref:2-hydroxycarboxylate transporter family protein n=1 Tax=Lactococcus formosensis TaxID=1281486 RepID=UPI001BCE5201|nr:2-hydroxycarboxylate transporter family protein [Lactococcus formosensis]MCO7180490.1 2-hydroxycarboxylate transporter family protein [Lactococcus formosensis]MDG6111230.1 2-hydroxycarboxylate transporter family protein [Lactococcus formosensis]MDG6113490.1 2-hydroxycarboxylate transporter family protein [Lactococcus formosensis]MDG6115656.1 2-hydroxycarboxylate transporter family protein [Lactococcus formosensis]MDG6117493.1 2-hydroxycarboxylate transporter family protein [Lactococcus form